MKLPINLLLLFVVVVRKRRITTMIMIMMKMMRMNQVNRIRPRCDHWRKGKSQVSLKVTIDDDEMQWIWAEYGEVFHRPQGALEADEPEFGS